MAKGCVHIHIKDGMIQNVFCHLGNLPKNGVVHLSPDKDLTEDDFCLSHPLDINEITIKPKDKIYNLGDDSI